MDVLVFLLGGAFGVSLSSLYLLIESIKRHGFTEDILMDIMYECASIIFIFALLNVYVHT